MENVSNFEIELNIANQIMDTVRRLQLPVKLDQLTEGRGNCFPIAVLQQCRRPEILSQLSPLQKEIVKQESSQELRNSVKQFIVKSENPKIVSFKSQYDESIALANGELWDQYWDKMTEDQMWVDYMFIQVTAWFLKLDMWIIDTSCTEANPYIKISGNLENENIVCNGPVITLGSKSNCHFQSLLPVEMFHMKLNSHQVQDRMDDKNQKPSQDIIVTGNMQRNTKPVNSEESQTMFILQSDKTTLKFKWKNEGLIECALCKKLC